MSHHMGVKNHVCELCNKAFYRKEYLTSHMAQHSGYSVELAKKKRSPRGYKPFIKEEDQDGEEEEGQEEEEPVCKQRFLLLYIPLYFVVGQGSFILTHLCRMDSSIFTLWTVPFPI